jgi:hypothetical protein
MHLFVDPNPSLDAPQPYGYRPTFGWTTAAASVFLFTFLVHLVQVIYYIVRRRKAQRPDTTKDADAEGLTGQHSTGRRPPKYWFILATLVPAALLETIGWWMRWRTLWEYYATEAGVSLLPLPHTPRKLNHLRSHS